jgi:hypothetical protein
MYGAINYLWLDFGLEFSVSRRITPWERMAGTTRLELATSAVTEWEHQVLTTTYKAVGDCQVLENTHKTNSFRVGHRVEKSTKQ